MRVLVTGGAGFVGSHIVEYFHHHPDVAVRVIDNISSGFKRNLAPFDIDFCEGSIEDKDFVMESMQGVDYVFHLAAMISVPQSMVEPQACFAANTIGTLNVLEAAAKAGAKKLVFSSSAAIYGNEPTLPKQETMKPQPLSPYAISKLDAEYLLDIYSKAWGIQTAALRYFNIFGPRQNPRSPYAAALPIFAERASNNQDITIFGDGTQTRDYIFVKDVAAANVFMMNKGNGVYNLGHGKTITIHELAKQIIEIMGSSSKIHFADERDGDVKHSRASIDKITALGFRPQHEWRESLEITLRAYQ